MEGTDQGEEKVHTNEEAKQQVLLGQGQQNDPEQQNKSENPLQVNESNAPTQQSHIGNMANTFLDTAMKTDYVENLTDSMQNIFPKNFQNLTDSMFGEDTSPQMLRNIRRIGSPSSGSGRYLQNKQSDKFLADISQARSIGSECMDNRYQQQNFRRNLMTGQEQCGDMLSPDSQRFSPQQEQQMYIPTPRSRRTLLEQAQCEDIPSGSQRFVPQHEQWRDVKSPGSWSYDYGPPGDSIHVQAQQKNVPLPVNKKEKKEKKSITTKTFAHGMMDVSLLTSNATQLRAVLSNPNYEFYTLLLWLIGLSIVLQLISAVLLIASDFMKTQVKEKDRKNQGKRKFLNFLSLTLVTLVMSLNVLISAFSSPVTVPQQVSAKEASNNIPSFSSPEFQTSRSEL